MKHFLYFAAAVLLAVTGVCFYCAATVKATPLFGFNPLPWIMTALWLLMAGGAFFGARETP